MNAKHKIALMMAAGFALHAAAIQGLPAQANPSAYFIAEINVSDPEAYAKEFLPLAMKAIRDAGAKSLARDGKTVSMEGVPPPSSVLVLLFESLDKAVAWWNSPATRDAFAVGERYATFHEFAVEGVPPTVVQVPQIQNSRWKSLWERFVY
ncbi:MAG TPA: DUF1330 domain-containing protein [Xanthobacteraceae bacterium]|nr:DUF1330 domain-containing protein [Xanthobacteraceae bacterium]